MKIRSLSVSALIVGGIVLIVMLILTLLDRLVFRNFIPWDITRNLEFLGAVCLIPLVFLVNGTLGAYFYRRSAGSLTILQGVLAGALGSFASGLVILAFRLAAIILFKELFTAVEVASLCFGLSAYLVPGALGGLIGGAIFRQTPPPDPEIS